jgi:stage III sporulation protein AG
MDFMKRLKEMLEGKNRKKLVENTVIVIIIGVIVIIAASTFLNGSKDSGASQPPAGEQENIQTAALTQAGSGDSTEDELAAILSKIQGVGRVEVMITYVSGKESVPAYDTRKNESSTDEKDSGGGTRSISQGEYDSSVVYEDRQGGGKSPVILKEMQPVVKGVLVVADGAGSPEVKERICSAVQVLMDIPIHKIQVVQMKK